MWLSYVAILFHLNSITGFSFHTFGTDFEYLTKEMFETIVTFDTSTIKTSWIEQPLDHFNTNDRRTWTMRYFEREDFWKPGKPVYLYLGGEGPARTVFIRTGTMFDLAKETNGAMFAAEHRYYGKSKPFEDYTAKNLEYLSSKQALADFAALLKSIKSLRKYKSSKVVVVGGSYSGNLAAWMKVLYPDLVDAAIASSAPVLAKKDFYQYLEVVSTDFEEYGSTGCWDLIALKFSEYERYFKSDQGIQIIKEEENICDSCDMTTPENQQLFFLEKASEFMYRAQYGNPTVIREYCESNFTSKFLKLRSRNLLWNERSKCYSYDFEDMIKNTRRIDRYVAWTYQTCTEFSYFQTGSSDNHPFTKNIPIDLYYKMCNRLFGASFDENRVERGVNESNRLYGGLCPNVSKVVFVNGDLDPWSTLSVLEDISYDAPSMRISQASHCRDLFSDRRSDPEELKEARKNIRNLIKSWIGEENDNS